MRLVHILFLCVFLLSACSSKSSENNIENITAVSQPEPLVQEQEKSMNATADFVPSLTAVLDTNMSTQNNTEEKIEVQKTDAQSQQSITKEFSEEEIEEDDIAKQLSFEAQVWKERIESAMEDVPCPDVQKINYPSSYYQGPLVDTHLHLPAIPDASPGEEMEEIPEARFGGPQALLGLNIKMSEIACTLSKEGTHKNFAFFPVYPEISKQLLEIVDRTIEKYPESFTPFIMPPGKDDIPPTVEADVLSEMLDTYPGLFKGYGEIGIYRTENGRSDYPPDLPLFQKIYSLVEKHNLLVYIHPGEGHTDNFEKVLKQYPHINFIVHGDEIQKDVLYLMDKYPNFYYGVDAFWGTDMELFHLFVGKSKEAFLKRMEEDFDDVLAHEVKKWKPIIEKHPDQFLWGIDRGDAVWNYDLEVGQMMVKFARAFIGTLDPSVQEKIAYKNAEKLIASVKE